MASGDDDDKEQGKKAAWTGGDLLPHVTNATYFFNFSQFCEGYFSNFLPSMPLNVQAFQKWLEGEQLGTIVSPKRTLAESTLAEKGRRGRHAGSRPGPAREPAFWTMRSLAKSLCGVQ
jgi:hypothetical protein